MTEELPLLLLGETSIRDIHNLRTRGNIGLSLGKGTLFTLARKKRAIVICLFKVNTRDMYLSRVVAKTAYKLDHEV